MATNQNTLSPALLSVLFELAAEGRVQKANLIGQVQQDVPLMYKDSSVKFIKHAPGNFTVHMIEAGTEVATAQVSSPVEAKLVTLDYIIAKAAKPLPALV